MVKAAYSFVAFCPIFGFGALYAFWPINDKEPTIAHKLASAIFFTALYALCLWIIWK